jgi:putative transposase
LMKTVKAKSSKYINDHHLTKFRFEWQEGYGCFRMDIHKLMQCINILPIKKNIIRNKVLNEYLGFLDKFEVPFDEQYVFADLI